MIENDSVQVTTVIAVEPKHAFEIFTEQTDLWWGKGPRFRPLSHPQGQMIFEGGIGGRLLEYVEDDATPPFVLGRIEAWEPPSRLMFTMGGRDFETDDWPVVEISFESVPEGTRVTLEHRGFAALAADHPVRHGLDGRAFLDVMGIFWADLLGKAQRHALAAANASPAPKTPSR
jgi:uncharacterized protein YndB with AHSA1/START domain